MAVVRAHRSSGAAQGGVTLIELMVTVSILVILLAIAVPGFQQILLQTRLRSYANDLAVDAVMARSEALKRNRTVKLCASADGATCAASGNWSQGWIVIDESVPTVIQRRAAIDANYTVVEAGDKISLSFPATGVGVTTASIKVCRSNPVGDEERQVSVSVSGWAQVTKTTAGTCP